MTVLSNEVFHWWRYNHRDQLTLTKITYTNCSFDWWVFLRRQRSNLFLKNTIGNPSCTCYAIESTTNLYYTDQYSAIRQQFTFSLQFIIPERISSNILLFDCNIVLADENIMLFINVQSCFLKSRRFM
jgi:hypothetical protein